MYSGPSSTKLPAPSLSQKAKIYLMLMRVDRPIGIFLLLWPTWWALWLAADGTPSIRNLVIFTLGVFLMRSAGCVINDIADRNIDGKVTRTRQRPLATGAATTREAIGLFITLLVLAFLLVLQTNTLTVWLSLGGVALASIYPFMKRHTHLPQVVLGAAFAWAIPMAYTAETGSLSEEIWLLYTATLVWTVAYDTLYAMVDREDDLKIGVKSTAILFGEADRSIIAGLQVTVILIFLIIGLRQDLGLLYHLGVIVAATLFVYQQHLIRYRQPEKCFKAFLHNNWVGLAIFAGIAFDLYWRIL